MKAGVIQERLAATNRWWRSETWQHDDPDLRTAAQAPYDYRPDVLAELRPGALYMLRGPRRVGKSTEVKRAIADLIDDGVDPRRIVHCSVDGWRARDLATLVGAAELFLLPTEAGRPRYWFIDEISTVAGSWPNEIKWLRDNDASFRHDTVVLTGSSALQLDEATKALAGRRGSATNTDRVLLPMGFSTFCRSTGLADSPTSEPLRPRDLHGNQVADTVRHLLPWTSELTAAWEIYLHVGGYPQAVSSWAHSRVVDPALTDALWDVILGEVIKARDFSALQTLGLLAILATNICSPLNVARLAGDVDVARATADSRLRDLVRAYLIWPVHRAEGGRPNLRAQTKFFFVDPLVARLAAIKGKGHPPDLTQLSQQQVGLTLLRSIAANGRTTIDAQEDLMYYRSSTGREIDFVGPYLGDVAVESKYVDGGWGREMQTIKASGRHGVLATRSGVEFGSSATVLPAPLLAVLLGG